MAKIEKYSFGSISIDGRAYDKDLIIYPDRVQDGWWRKEGHRLQIDDIRDVLADPPEVLVVGQGDSARMRVDPRVNEALAKLEVQLIAAPTKRACEEFNRLSAQGKHVVAALHLTC
jgi:hypothetical protein